MKSRNQVFLFFVYEYIYVSSFVCHFNLFFLSLCLYACTYIFVYFFVCLFLHYAVSYCERLILNLFSFFLPTLILVVSPHVSRLIFLLVFGSLLISFCPISLFFPSFFHPLLCCPSSFLCSPSRKPFLLSSILLSSILPCCLYASGTSTVA
jgi:hypothetical protein